MHRFFFSVVQGIHGMQAAQGAGAGQQQNVVMVQPSQNLTSMTSNPASSNACKFIAIFFSLQKLYLTNIHNILSSHMFTIFSTKFCGRHTSNGKCIRFAANYNYKWPRSTNHCYSIAIFTATDTTSQRKYHPNAK